MYFVGTATGQSIPSDTIIYDITTENGASFKTKRPPDSLLVPCQILIRFRQGQLNYSKLLTRYLQWYYGVDAIENSGQTAQTELTFPDYGNRGYPEALRVELLREKFYFDSSNNIVESSSLKNFLIQANAYSLERLTSASPIDSISITRTGDTIGCDHYNWMVLNMNCSVNPLVMAYLLNTYYHNEIIMAVPTHYTVELLRRPGEGILHDSCERGFTMQIGAEKAWNYEVGDDSVLVALYDQGVDYRHPDLGGGIGPGFHVRYGTQYYIPIAPSAPAPIFKNASHGTPSIGIIGALTNRNFESVSGLAGGWGTLPGGTDTIERGKGASLVVLADNALFIRYYVASLFEASARSKNTPYGTGVHAMNTSALIARYPDLAVHAAVNYAFENRVVQVAAMNQQFGGLDPTGKDESEIDAKSFPAGYEESWVMSIGGSISNKNRTKPSHYGYTMDMIAPSGDNQFGCVGPILNWSTQSVDTVIPPNPVFFFEGFAGNSAAAPNVTGSVALLLSHFRQMSPDFKKLEPEDYSGILKAAAWRADEDRDTSFAQNDWRRTSGWGHLDIGRAFEMLDPNRTANTFSGYQIRHYNYVQQPDFGEWTTIEPTLDRLFDIPTSTRIHSSADTAKIKQFNHRSYLLNYVGGRSSYKVRIRPVTYTVSLDSIWEVSNGTPLFAWGRSGGSNEKSGWSASLQNFQTGYTKVISCTGGDSLNEGIFHTQGTTFTVQTFQYNVWGWDPIASSYSNYIGHCPPDSMLGVNFTVYGRSQIGHSSVYKQLKELESTMNVKYHPSNQKVTINFHIEEGEGNMKLEIYDLLGVCRYRKDIGYVNKGWNTIEISADKLNTGVFICRLAGSGYTQSRRFQIIR